MAEKTLEHTLVNVDPFNGNQCKDEKCLPNQNKESKINFRRNCICYKITCNICQKDGKSENFSTCYFGESGKNMHRCAKEHLSKLNSKTEKVISKSAFFEHLQSHHGGRAANKSFSDYFTIQILKAYKKPFTKCVEEGALIANHEGELLNSKSEWHQAKIIRTTTSVVQGGADALREQQQHHQQQGGQGSQGSQAREGSQARQDGHRGRTEQEPRVTSRRTRGQ